MSIKGVKIWIKEYTQEELAKIIDIIPRQLQKIEKNKNFNFTFIDFYSSFSF